MAGGSDRPLKAAMESALKSGNSLDDSEWLSSKRAGRTNELAPVRAPLSSVPQLALSRWRFAFTVTVSLCVLVALLTVFEKGIVIDKNVLDEMGSTKNVNEKVERYQVLIGYVKAAVGLIMERFFEVFTVVTVTFLANVRWYPGDEPRTGGNRFKRLCLWAFTPWIMFVLNVAISATNVSHKITGVVRVFLDEDLATQASQEASVVTLNATSVTNLTSLGNKRSVLDTILRGAVRRQISPFEMLTNSPCVLGNVTDASEDAIPADLPSVKELSSTTVVYGFPLQDWNLDAMPFGLLPRHNVTLRLGDVNSSESELVAKFNAFQSVSNISWFTMYELLLQGKVLFERSVSDSDTSSEYPCIRVEDPDLYASILNRPTEASNVTDTNTTSPAAVPRARRRRLQASSDTGASSEEDEEAFDEEELEDLESGDDVYSSGPFKNQRKCYGAVTSLQDLANMTDTSMHTISKFVNTTVDGFITTVEAIEPESMDLTISTYVMNSQIKFTAMTLDMPYRLDISYRGETEYCEGPALKESKIEELKGDYGNDTTAEDIAYWETALCDPTSYSYDKPREACGHSNCIFLDKSKTIPFRRELQLMPYLTNCSTADIKYSEDFLNYFPKDCKQQEHAVFLYGLGSYISGSKFSVGDNDSFPFIDNPRRHVVLSFVKLEWETEDLSSKFQASCGADNDTSKCQGLLYSLENVTQRAYNVSGSSEKHVRMLVLGKDHLPADRMTKDFRDPVKLVSLNTRPFYYAKQDDYYEWENIQKSNFETSTWPKAATSKDGKPTPGLSATECSPLIDSYIGQIEKNHFYIDDPLQPLYTSALFYLFQDAAVKTVKVTRNVTTGVEALELAVVGTTTFKGDLEKHIIKFSIPLASLISTFAGMLFLLLLVVLVLVCPTERLKISEESNVAVQYAELLQHDEYPKKVFERALVLPSGERVAMDEYVVESATVHFTRDADQKLFL